MDSEVKKALDDLLKLELDETAQQLIVNLVSALAKSGTNCAASTTTTTSSPRGASFDLSIDENHLYPRVEESGVDWSPVRLNPVASATPMRVGSFRAGNKPLALLKRQVSRSPNNKNNNNNNNNNNQQHMSLEEAWAELDLKADEAYKSYCEYRLNLSKAFQAYEEFCANYMSREAIELTKKWRDFVMSHRRAISEFDEQKLRRQRGEPSPTTSSSLRFEGYKTNDNEEEEIDVVEEDAESAIRRVFDRKARARRLEELERRREAQSQRRRERIAWAANELSYWQREAKRSDWDVRETRRKRDEIRRQYEEFKRKAVERRLMLARIGGTEQVDENSTEEP